MAMLRLPLTTTRLTVRRPVRSDMGSWRDLYSTPLVRVHLNGPIDRTEAEWWSGMSELENNDDQTLSVFLSSTNEFVGTCGFLNGKHDSAVWEVYVILCPKFWRQGLASELTRCLVATAFSDLRADRVIGVVDPKNAASIEMITKLGFIFSGTFSQPGQWQDGHHVYDVTCQKDQVLRS